MVRRKRVTIKQVAQEAGVSTQTVSRVINNRPDVAPSTRRHVQSIIDRLGYRPSHAARILSQGHSDSIGVVAYGIEYFGPSRAVSGIEKQASELGYTPLLYLLRQPESTNVARIISELLSHHVDGIIWAVPQIADNRSWIDLQLSRLPVPLVFLSMEPRQKLTVIGVDNYLGGRLAAEHLTRQGYRNMGVITGPPDWWEAQERVRGFGDALLEAGLTLPDDKITIGNWSAASGQRGFDELLERHPDLDALFVCNDQMALGALQAAYRRELRIPQDLAIMGFDDLPEAAFFQPPLTTISQPLFEAGCTSVKELDRLIKGNESDDVTAPPKIRTLKPALIVRESTMAGADGETPQAAVRLIDHTSQGGKSD